MKTAREEVVLRPKACGLDPLLHGLASWRRDFELNRPMRFLLHDDRPRGNLVAMTDVAYLEVDKIAAPELRVDAEIEEREVSYAIAHLHPDPKRPNVLQFEGRLLPDDLPLVPWFTVRCTCLGFHDGLPSS